MFGSPSNKIKVGVVGVGVLGRYHTKIYSESRNAELVGVCDVSPKAAEAVAKEFGTKAFASLRELAEQCDALSVAVPATEHHATAMELMAMNKHVLMEKPIAVTVAEAEEMVKTAEERGLVFGVGHVERCNPAMDYLEKHHSNTLFIEAHRLAKYPPPRPGQHRRGTEVSVVLDLMIHDLDLVLTMVRAPVERIDAVGIPVLSKTEDIANVRIKFANGAVANVTASRMSPEPMRKFRVFQTDSYISMDYAHHSGKIYRRGLIGVSKKQIDLCETNALAAELENFIACVAATKENGGTVVKPRVSGQDGLNALALAVRITDEISSYNNKYGLYKLRKP